MLWNNFYPRHRECYYDFGSWGYFRNGMEGRVLPGFATEPPGVEICGVYEIIFAAALQYDNRIGNANILLRRTATGSVRIEEATKTFHVNVTTNQGFSYQRQRTTNHTIFSGRVNIYNNGAFFGDGYNIFGFAPNSRVAETYQFMPSNATTVVTKRNNNIGRLYTVSDRKAFRLIHRETGPMTMTDHHNLEMEVQEAERICHQRHYSFLCRDLGLPCSVASRISSFVIDPPPFIFAEPGDLWIDIRLTTPKRTYILARRKKQSEQSVLESVAKGVLFSNSAQYEKVYKLAY